MSLKKFIYFITDTTGKCLQVVNGTVQLLNQLKQLSQAPDGNQEIAIGWERISDHGTIRNFSLPLGFLMEAAMMLRHEFYTYNLDIKRYLMIKRLTYEWTALTFKEYYKQLYKGELDFSTSDDSQGDYRFNINIMEGGFNKLLKAGENTRFDIPLDIDSKNLINDGVKIITRMEYLVNNGGENDGVNYEMRNHFVGINPILSDSSFQMSFLGVLRKQFIGTNADLPNNENYFFAATTSGILHLEWSFKVGAVNLAPISPGTTEIAIQVVANGSVDVARQVSVFSGLLSGTGTVITGSADINVERGDKIYFRTFYTVIGATGDAVIRYTYYIEDGVDSYFKASASYRGDTTVIKVFTIHDLGRKIVEKITGNADDFESTLLLGKNLLITSGDGLRGLTGASIKTTWKDFKQAVNAYYMTGVQVGTKIRIEGRAEYYKPESVVAAIELGEIKNFKCTPALDQLGTSIKVGHQEQEVDDVNGRFDFNGFQIYTTPIKGIPAKEIDLQSPWKAGPYEIERKRLNLEGKVSTDSETDNDVYAIVGKHDPADDTFDTTASFFADGTPFAPGAPLLGIVAPFPLLKPGMIFKVTGSTLNDQNLSVKSSATWFFGQLIVTNEPLINEPGVVITIEILEGQYYTLDRDIPITQLTVPDVAADIRDSTYNVPLSPKRMLIQHFAWLAGMLDKYAPEVLKFESANRNKELIAGGIIEKADVPVADLGAPLFLPYYFEFDTLSPVDMVALLEANPTPVFGFIWKDVRYTGFYIRGGIALNDLEEQTFKLLATPDNNVLNLI